MRYTCICGESMELRKATIKVVEGRVITTEAVCICGEYMEAEAVDGIPTLIRTDPTLDSTKNRKRIEREIEDNKEYL